MSPGTISEKKLKWIATIYMAAYLGTYRYKGSTKPCRFALPGYYLKPQTIPRIIGAWLRFVSLWLRCPILRQQCRRSLATWRGLTFIGAHERLSMSRSESAGYASSFLKSNPRAIQWRRSALLAGILYAQILRMKTWPHAYSRKFRATYRLRLVRLWTTDDVFRATYRELLRPWTGRVAESPDPKALGYLSSHPQSATRD